MGFYVSRQNYYHSGLKVVEIETNGLDYSGADTLGVQFKHLGEWKEFDDPRDAVKAAIAVRDAWKAIEPDIDGITFGTSGGMGFEGEPFEGTDEGLLALATERYEALPKCDSCGDVLGDKTYKLFDSIFEDERFCSENCAEKRAADNQDTEEEEEEEEEEDAD